MDVRFSEARLEGGWFKVRVNPEDLGQAMQFLRNMKKKLYVLTAKEFRKKRSLDANAYAWLLIGKLAAAIRISPDEVYQQYMQDIGDNAVIVEIPAEDAVSFDRAWCKGHLGRRTDNLGESRTRDGYCNIRAVLGSSDFDTVQMTRFIDLIIDDCHMAGIEVRPQEEIDSLMEEWK